jgi:histidine triad (HIT) family protein
MAAEDCLFCKIVTGKERSWIVYRDRYIMAILDPFPITEGHTLVIPIRHYESMFDIPYPLLRRIITRAKRLCMTYERTLRIQGVSIDVLNHRFKTLAYSHFHLHVIPRYNKNEKRDPANVKPSQTFPRESDAKLDRILDVIRRTESRS